MSWVLCLLFAASGALKLQGKERPAGVTAHQRDGQRQTPALKTIKFHDPETCWRSVQFGCGHKTRRGGCKEHLKWVSCALAATATNQGLTFQEFLPVVHDMSQSLAAFSLNFPLCIKRKLLRDRAGGVSDQTLIAASICQFWDFASALGRHSQTKLDVVEYLTLFQQSFVWGSQCHISETACASGHTGPPPGGAGHGRQRRLSWGRRGLARCRERMGVCVCVFVFVSQRDRVKAAQINCDSKARLVFPVSAHLEEAGRPPVNTSVLRRIQREDWCLGSGLKRWNCTER